MRYGFESVCADTRDSGLCEVQLLRNLVGAVNRVDIEVSRGFGKVMHETVGMGVDTAR